MTVKALREFYARWERSEGKAVSILSVRFHGGAGNGYEKEGVSGQGTQDRCEEEHGKEDNNAKAQERPGSNKQGRRRRTALVQSDLLGSLGSAKAWTDIVTGSFTAGVLLVAGIVAFWRFVLQRPYGNHWAIQGTTCCVRRAKQGTGYVVTLTIENRSAAGQRIRGWWRRIRLPRDLPDDYNPDTQLDVLTRDAAIAYYSSASITDHYPLASGEKYIDQMIHFDDSPTPEQICYVEYSLEYRRWRWLPIPWRVPEFISQKMVAPIEDRADFAPVAAPTQG